MHLLSCTVVKHTIQCVSLMMTSLVLKLCLVCFILNPSNISNLHIQNLWSAQLRIYKLTTSVSILVCNHSNTILYFSWSIMFIKNGIILHELKENLHHYSGNIREFKKKCALMLSLHQMMREYIHEQRACMSNYIMPHSPRAADPSMFHSTSLSCSYFIPSIF